MPFWFCLWEGAYGRGLSLGAWVLLIYGVINLVISVLQAGFLAIWVLHIKFGTILPFGCVLFAGRGGNNLANLVLHMDAEIVCTLYTTTFFMTLFSRT